MKIDDVPAIYDFLGNIDIPAFISLCILISIAMLILIAYFKEGSKMSKTSMGVLLLFVNLALISLYVDAQNNAKSIQLATYIKEDLVGSNYFQKTFRQIILPQQFKPGDKVTFLKNLAERFPKDFFILPLHRPVGSFTDVLDTNAIVLIDDKLTEKIDEHIGEKANRTAHLLVTIMNSRNIDTIKINNIELSPGAISLQQIDNEGWLIGPRFLNALIARNDLQPVYDDFHNITAFTIAKNVKPFTVQGRITYH